MEELWQIIKGTWREFEYKLALWIKRKFSKQIIIQEDYDEWHKLLHEVKPYEKVNRDIFPMFDKQSGTTLLDRSLYLKQLADKFHSEEVFHARIKENLPTLRVITKFIDNFGGELSQSDLEIVDELTSQIKRNLDKSILFLESLQELRDEDLRNAVRTFKEGE